MDDAIHEKLLTVAELARRLDVGQGKVRDLAREGLIPSVMVGAGRRFDWHEVIEALRSESARTAEQGAA